MHIHATDLKGSTGPYRYASNIRSRVFAARHHGARQIARAKPEVDRLAGLVLAREAILVRPAHLPAAVPSRLDMQRLNLGDSERIWCALSYTGGIQPMRLGQHAAHAVVFGEAAAACFHR